MTSSITRTTLSSLLVLVSGLSIASCAAGMSVTRTATRPEGSYASHLAWLNALDPRTLDAPAGRNAYGAPNSTVILPMTFPILGRGYGFSDEFGAERDGHRHLGQDLFAPKMTPLVAVFDGTVYFWTRGGVAPHNIINLIGDNGYTVKYMHVNNDTPGTNDGRGGVKYAFAPGLVSGQHVRQGQFLGWVGNSGNAESTPAHTHFELWGPDGMVTNATASLRRATRLNQPVADIPQPEWQPGRGEVRWDGILQGVDPTRGVLILQLLATTANTKSVGITKPGATYVRVAPTAVMRDAGGTAVRFRDLPIGGHIALRGNAPAKNRAFTARAGLLPDNMPTFAPVAPNAPPEEPLDNDAAQQPDNRNLGQRLSDWWNGVKRRGKL